MQAPGIVSSASSRCAAGVPRRPRVAVVGYRRTGGAAAPPPCCCGTRPATTYAVRYEALHGPRDRRHQKTEHPRHEDGLEIKG